MFYCNNCATENKWPETISKSFGRCESCGENAECNNAASSLLSFKKNDDAIQAGKLIHNIVLDPNSLTPLEKFNTAMDENITNLLAGLGIKMEEKLFEDLKRLANAGCFVIEEHPIEITDEQSKMSISQKMRLVWKGEEELMNSKMRITELEEALLGLCSTADKFIYDSTSSLMAAALKIKIVDAEKLAKNEKDD